MECALFNGLKFDDSAYFYVGGQVMRVTTQMLNSYQRDSIGIKRGALSILANGNKYSKRTNVNSLVAKTRNNVASKNTYLKGTIKGKKLLDLINNSNCFSTSGNIGECKGIKFNLKDVERIKTSGLKEVKAENNVIDFGDKNYLKYVSSDGKEHVLYARNGIVETPMSCSITGEPWSRETERYAGFWRYLMARDTVYIGLSYSDNEVEKYLADAGIEKGFFTIKMGGKEITKYYSASKSTNCIQDKWRYDQHYDSITQGILFRNYEPGSVFKVGGKEYILNENHALDVPYGEDVYDMEYPANYKFGKKID